MGIRGEWGWEEIGYQSTTICDVRLGKAGVKVRHEHSKQPLNAGPGFGDMKYLTTLNGELELHICDDSDRFVEVAKKIQALTGGYFTAQIDGVDQSYWDITICRQQYTIHREHYLGVSISSGADNARTIFEKIERELTL